MGQPEENQVEEEKVSGEKLGVRHVQVAMLFFAISICYAMRVNMSLSLVVMSDVNLENHFDWSIQIQSVILSSFFWGYIVLQIPAGLLASKFGGMVLLSFCVGLNSAICLLIPISAYYGGWKLLCSLRVLQGLSQGFLLPVLHHLMGKWIPLEEKSRLGSLIYSGGQFGTAIQLMAAGFIADYWGWPAIFYTNGVLGAVWTALYVFLGADSPQSSRIISEEERAYIQHSLGHVGGQTTKYKTPWKAIWTSMPFISLMVAHCGQNWGYWTLMTEMPSYMNHVLGVNIKANGVMSALPYVVFYAMSFPLGFTSDYVLKKGWITITTARKLSNSLGFYGPAIALIGMTYVPVGNVLAAVLVLTLVVSLNAGHYTGFLLVHIDMAPNFAGTLMGITNASANILSIIAPLAAGSLLKDETNPGDWLKVFYLSSVVYVVSNTFYLLFGSSETQIWNEPSADNADAEADKEKYTKTEVQY